MKYFLPVILLMISTTAIAQTKSTYDTTRDEDGNLVFNGLITFTALDGEKSFDWMNAGGYTPDAKDADYLSKHLHDYKLVVFMGTWCSDSHEMIPKLEKVLRMNGYPLETITMYGTDHDKKTKGGEEKKYGITLVPTVIVYKDGKEAGRITESVQKSVEHDLVEILKK